MSNKVHDETMDTPARRHGGKAMADEAETLADQRREISRLRGLLEAAQLGQTIPTNPERRTPPTGVLEELMSAVSREDLDMVTRLIKGSWQLNILAENGRSPLHEAAFMGNVDICRSLIRAGASIRFLDKNGANCSISAASNGKLDKFSRAVDEEFLNAAYSNDQDTVEGLIEAKWNVNVADAHGLTALHKAAGQGHTLMCRKLTENGARIDARDTENETPLQKASAKGQHGVVAYLASLSAQQPKRSSSAESASSAKEEGHKKSASLYKKMNMISLFVFANKNRKDKTKLGHERLAEAPPERSASAEEGETSGETLKQGSPFAREAKKQSSMFAAGQGKLRRGAKSMSLPAGASLPTATLRTQPSRVDEDDTQCDDTEHQLWGQFLDPARRGLH